MYRRHIVARNVLQSKFQVYPTLKSEDVKDLKKLNIEEEVHDVEDIGDVEGTSDTKVKEIKQSKHIDSEAFLRSRRLDPSRFL